MAEVDFKQAQELANQLRTYLAGSGAEECLVAVSFLLADVTVSLADNKEVAHDLIKHTAKVAERCLDSGWDEAQVQKASFQGAGHG